MKNVIIYLTILVCLSATKLFAQDIKSQDLFCDKADAIAKKIERITKDEKANLKQEVEAVNVQLDNKKITQDDADAKKNALAEATAIRIENQVGILQNVKKPFFNAKKM